MGREPKHAYLLAVMLSACRHHRAVRNESRHVRRLPHDGRLPAPAIRSVATGRDSAPTTTEVNLADTIVSTGSLHLHERAGSY